MSGLPRAAVPSREVVIGTRATLPASWRPNAHESRQRCRRAPIAEPHGRIAGKCRWHIAHSIWREWACGQGLGWGIHRVPFFGTTVHTNRSRTLGGTPAVYFVVLRNPMGRSMLHGGSGMGWVARRTWV